MKNKISILILIAVMMTFVTACGQKKEVGEAEIADTQEQEAVETPPTLATQEPQMTMEPVITPDPIELDKRAAKEVSDAISQIKKISLDNGSEDRIKTAREKYNNLTADQKTYVKNLKKLNKAEKRIKKLKKYKKVFKKAQKKMSRGYLNGAYKLLKKIPRSFKYKGTSVRKLRKRIESHRAMMRMCGVWRVTGGQMRVTQYHDSTGIYHYWYRDFKYKDGDKVYVYYKINKKGVGRLVVNGSIPIYTNYSSLGRLLKESYALISKNKKRGTFKTYKTDSHTRMTITPRGIIGRYNYTDNSESVYFTYRYKTEMRFTKRVKKY